MFGKMQTFNDRTGPACICKAGSVCYCTAEIPQILIQARSAMSEICYRLLLYLRNNIVGHPAYTEAEQAFVKPLMSKNGGHYGVI